MGLEQTGVELITEGGAAFENALSGAAGVLNAFFDVAGQAADAIIDFASDSFSSALEAEQSLSRLNTVIESTGGAAGLTGEEAEALAAQFMNLAGGSDDAVLAIQEMALRMGTVTEEEMPAFIQTTLDLAAATGVDAVNAARLLAQAQEDPISALTRFKRQGILFTEAQAEQIKKLQESGDTAGAFALVMERVGEATGGAALANSQTLAGQMEVLKGNFGEAGEAIAAAFLPMAHELFDTFLAPAIPILADFSSKLSTAFGLFLSGSVDLQGFVNIIGSLVDNYLPGAGAATRVFTQALTDAQTFVTGTLLPQLQPLIDAVLNVGAAFGESSGLAQAHVAEMVAFVGEQFNIFFPTIVTNVTDSLNTIAEFWRAHGDEIMAVVDGAFRVIVTTVGGALTLVSGVISATLNWISGIWNAATLALSGDWAGAWAEIVATNSENNGIITATLTTFMNGVLALVGTDLATFTATWQTNFDMAAEIVDTVLGQMQATIDTWVGEAVGAFQSFIIDTINAFQSTDWGSVGQGIIDGIGAGITGAVGGLTVAAANAAGAALTAAKGALGIKSPSREAAREIGLPFSEGIAEGILFGLRDVESATAALAGSLFNPPAQMMQAMGNTYHSNHTTQISLAASYPLQSERSLAADVRMLQMLQP